MTTPRYLMTGRGRNRTQVEVSVEQLLGGCVLYIIERKTRKAEAPAVLEAPK